MKSLIAFVALYVLAVCTPFGQAAENSLIVGYADQARIFHILYSIGPPPLKAEWATLIIGLALIAIVAVLRRQWLNGLAGLGVAVATIGGTEVLNKFILPRPDISDAPRTIVEASFPSGHVAIAAGLTVGAIMVASPRTRPYVAAAGALWLAITAAGVQALYWHRPSDALGATLLACACYTIASRKHPMPKPHTALVLTVAALGAVLASSRTDAYARPLIFATTATLCAALLWFTVTRNSPAEQPASARMAVPTDRT
ncbi:phosphatase PAP2 family protein [Kribbella catacumbae]|uniref:phosphatase PAP2 family protein n=1 Tax=Kribbella catacumbae TaxID=460086 RepID=UPI000379FB11|nr:phosphatase PAP2 family protein [Kribbella catacumbae]